MVLALKDGKLESIEIEDLSMACSDSEPEDLLEGFNYTFVDRTKKAMNCSVKECVNDPENGNVCDPKIFVSWVGTDKDGKVLISASDKITGFKNYDIPQMFQSILKINANNAPAADNSMNSESESGQLDYEVSKRLADPSQIIAEEGAGSGSVDNSHSQIESESSNGASMPIKTPGRN